MKMTKEDIGKAMRVPSHNDTFIILGVEQDDVLVRSTKTNITLIFLNDLGELCEELIKPSERIDYYVGRRGRSDPMKMIHGIIAWLDENWVKKI